MNILVVVEVGEPYMHIYYIKFPRLMFLVYFRLLDENNQRTYRNLIDLYPRL